jgi:predicted Fe-S protein YdhL (DUF1289 family)
MRTAFVPEGTTQTSAPCSGARCSDGRQHPNQGSQRESTEAGSWASAVDEKKEKQHAAATT